MLSLLVANSQRTFTEVHQVRPASASLAAPPNNDAKIVDYWNRRPTLTESEWIDFYQLVMPKLMRTRLPEEYNDNVQRFNLAYMFFQDKILVNAATSKAGPLESAHALHGFLKKFAIDILRKQMKEALKTESLDEMHEKMGENEAVEAKEDEVGVAQQSAYAYAQLLKEAGIDIEQVQDSAAQFVRSKQLTDGDREYLLHHFCANKEEAESLLGIKKRLGLGSTYYIQAQKLGITRKKGETYKEYGTSKIGRWLLSVGAQLHPDWCEELAALLIVLCLQVKQEVQ